jgi:hypothetical protein
MSELHDWLQERLATFSELFPGHRVTLIVRLPGSREASLVMGDDNVSDALAAARQLKLSGVPVHGPGEPEPELADAQV